MLRDIYAPPLWPKPAKSRRFGILPTPLPTGVNGAANTGFGIGKRKGLFGPLAVAQIGRYFFT
jgi:hypothetical protein